MQIIPRMQVPSGRVLYNPDIELVQLMFEHQTVWWSEQLLTLRSGAQSHFYMSGREDFTDNPYYLYRTGSTVARIVKENTRPTDKQACLIGIPTAGTAIAAAASMASNREGYLSNGKAICFRVMRENLKGHGAGANKGWVNGKPETDKHTYWRVDNVSTGGGSKVETELRLQEDGYPTIHTAPDDCPSLIFIDREQGAQENLKAAGFTRVVVGFYISDILFVFQELHLWPKERVAHVLAEVEEAHQKALYVLSQTTVAAQG